MSQTKRPATGASGGKRATRAINRANIVDENFSQAIRAAASGTEHPALGKATPLSPRLNITDALSIFDAQMMSRHLDFSARQMRARGEGFYTIGSSGHESNAVLGHLLRVTDPAFLHYRSGGFVMARSLQAPDADPVYDAALSLAASSEDPISGGRHKVWGSRELWIPPQTSTIASHLAKAVGTAIAIAQCKRLGASLPVPADSIVYCSFGDASANHNVAQGAFNAAEWTAYQKLPAPILFMCEDNGLGISVHTPRGWIEQSFSQRANLAYFAADGTQLSNTHDTALSAIDYVRRTRRPAFLHLKQHRLLAHAGTDVESEYRPMADIETSEAADPLIRCALTLIEAGALSAEQILAQYEQVRAQVDAACRRAATRPKLTSVQQVSQPLAPYRPDAVNAQAAISAPAPARAAAFGGADKLPENGPPRHLAIQINRALRDLLACYPQMILFGEDVAQKGGVYTVTTGLASTFGPRRVFNTLLDETTILGMAQGAAYMGLMPVPEIQYLAYLHNAADQLRGEACSTQFFSNGQYANPMIVRIASLAYQRGFGGHFHNDNSFTALRDIPGLIIACPARGDDAAMMLRTCAALGQVDGRVVAFLEPIALYMTKDLHEERDAGWSFPYPAPGEYVPLGEPRTYHADADDLLIVTYGNGVRMSLRVAKRLQAQGHACRVLDLRWLKPLNTQALARHANEVGRVLVVDEGRATGGISEQIFTALDEHARPGVAKSRVVGEDSYIPLADAANLVLVSEQQIEDAAVALLS